MIATACSRTFVKIYVLQILQTASPETTARCVGVNDIPVLRAHIDVAAFQVAVDDTLAVHINHCLQACHRDGLRSVADRSSSAVIEVP